MTIAAKFAGLAIVFSLTGMEPFSGQLAAMEESFGEVSAMYESVGMSEAQIAAARDTFTQNIAMVRLLLPLVVVTMGLLDTMANFWALGKLLARLGQSVPPLPPFREWRLPAAFFYIFGLRPNLSRTKKGCSHLLLAKLNLQREHFSINSYIVIY